MNAAVPFTFGIALIARRCTRNWPLVEALLELTLASVRAQTDPDFQVIIGGHDRPRLHARDPRISFIAADWPGRAPGADNADGARKKRLITEVVLERGGGLLMLLDADDWVDVRLVAAARALIGPERAGALIEHGIMVDLQSLRAAPLPHAHVFDRPFHRLCGSSSIARLRPDHPDPLRRDPTEALGSHHEWVEAAQAHGLALTRLPVLGSYLVNTSENHSEVHGRHVGWRRRLTARANRIGEPLEPGLAARFGLTLGQVRATSERFFAAPDPGLRTQARQSA